MDGWRRNGTPGCGVRHFNWEVVRRQGHQATEGETTAMMMAPHFTTTVTTDCNFLLFPLNTHALEVDMTR